MEEVDFQGGEAIVDGGQRSLGCLAQHRQIGR